MWNTIAWHTGQLPLRKTEKMVVVSQPYNPPRLDVDDMQIDKPGDFLEVYFNPMVIHNDTVNYELSYIASDEFSLSR